MYKYVEHKMFGGKLIMYFRTNRVQNIRPTNIEDFPVGVMGPWLILMLVAARVLDIAFPVVILQSHCKFPSFIFHESPYY